MPGPPATGVATPAARLAQPERYVKRTTSSCLERKSLTRTSLAGPTAMSRGNVPWPPAVT